MLRKKPFAEGEFYHLYNRGNDKRSIFTEDTDRERFVRLLYLSNTASPIIFREVKDAPFKELTQKYGKISRLTAIGSYCLMPNHFHILVKETVDGGISAFMQKLQTAYSMYFNKKNGRIGTLFEGRFKSEHVGNDNYLKYLFAYIHLNPVKLIDPSWKKEGISDVERTQRFLSRYPYSSYCDFLNIDRPEKAILDRQAFPEYFESRHEFGFFIEEWLHYEDERKEWKEEKRVYAVV